MNSKIFEHLKFTTRIYNRTYSAFADDEWGSWVLNVNGRQPENRITKNLIYSFGFGYTNSPQTGSLSATRTIKGLRKAKSIHFTFNAYWWVERGWYIRDYIDGHMKLLDGYIYIRSGQVGNYIQVGSQTLLDISNNGTYNLTFYQKYLICNGTRYDYPEGVKLSKAEGEGVEGYAYAGYITSNDYYVAHYQLNVGDIEVKHTA